METKSELKVVYVALAILICQTLGIDVSAALSLLDNPDSHLSTIQAAHGTSQGAGWEATLLAAGYAICRTYIKGRRQ